MRKIITALAATAALGAVAAQPAAAQDTCKAWWVSKGTLVQDGGWKVKLPAQNGNRLNGKATATGPYRMTGTMRGGVTGSFFRVTVSWSNGTSGVYEGNIDSDGFLQGVTKDRFNRVAAGFRMYGQAHCIY